MKDTALAPKPRLAIVSTYDDLCGIAGYTRSLVSYLSDIFDIEVFDLDQYVMRATGGSVMRLADQQIADICTRFCEFDFVNIQLEYGTLGYFQKDILRRFKQLIGAAPALSVTFHTILRAQPFPKTAIRRAVFRAEIWNTYQIIRDFRQERDFRNEVYSCLRKMQASKPVNVIVHTRRDAKEMRLLHRFKSVYDHPLAFVPQSRARGLRQVASRDDFAGLAHLPKDAKVLGIFGFLSEYKGIHTAIRALQLLPDDYHLAVFGGLHPQEIKKSNEVHPYVGTLLAEIHVGETLIQSLRSEPGAGNISVSLDGAAPKALLQSPRDISARVHFLGAPSDEDLARAMAISDIAILPYFEVGQSSSGPMSMALEMGAPIIAARNHAFLQFSQYHPGRLNFFEIGNHLELAQKIRAMPARAAGETKLDYTTDTNKDIYWAANTPEHAHVD
jgi:glycosyltransferase involved in cell wall biosynthesis